MAVQSSVLSKTVVNPYNTNQRISLAALFKALDNIMAENLLKTDDDQFCPIMNDCASRIRAVSPIEAMVFIHAVSDRYLGEE